MRLGEYQELEYIKRVDFGIYLAESQRAEERVLLPAKQVPEGIKLGDRVRVFLYKDSRDRLIATTNEPKLSMGEIRPLEVKECGKIGAFLDWGLEKDLFLPYKEMTKESPYKKDDMVSGRVYEFSDNFGCFVAVDDKYSARIPRHEDTSFLRVGDVIDAKVTAVKEDGKLDLTLREKAYIQMDSDSEKIMELLDSYAGVLPFSEKASPEVIKRETGLSKNAFKRAVGHLYKERKIDLTDGKIRRV